MSETIRSTGPALLLAVCAACAPAQAATEIDCEGGRAMVHGSGNHAYIVCHCSSVTVGGSDNTLTLDGADVLTVGGENNTVRYRGLDGGAPYVTVGGTDNEVVRLEEAAVAAPLPDRAADAPARPNATPSAAPSAGDTGLRVAARGDGLDGVEAIVHQSYTYSSGDFRSARDHAWALYADGTALRTPNIAFMDIDKALSRRAWPEGWFEWRRSGGRIEVKGSGDPGFAPLKGEADPVRAAANGLRLSGDYTFVRTYGSMMRGNAGSTRNTYSFTPEGRYTISNSNFIGSGMDVGAGQVVVASQCDENGSRAQIVTDSPSAPGGSTRGDGCGDANAGRYHIDGYAITLAADDGTIRRVGFYAIDGANIMIDATGYWPKDGG